MKLKAYNIVADAVEQGVGFGWRRTFKHQNGDDLDDAAAIEAITNEVLNALSEIIDWDDRFTSDPDAASDFLRPFT